MEHQTDLSCKNEVTVLSFSRWLFFAGTDQTLSCQMQPQQENQAKIACLFKLELLILLMIF